jgi:hypothetical protein
VGLSERIDLIRQQGLEAGARFIEATERDEALRTESTKVEHCGIRTAK